MTYLLITKIKIESVSRGLLEIYIDIVDSLFHFIVVLDSWF